jgi:hypothetical protein
MTTKTLQAEKRNGEFANATNSTKKIQVPMQDDRAHATQLFDLSDMANSSARSAQLTAQSQLANLASADTFHLNPVAQLEFIGKEKAFHIHQYRNRLGDFEHYKFKNGKASAVVFIKKGKVVPDMLDQAIEQCAKDWTASGQLEIHKASYLTVSAYLAKIKSELPPVVPIGEHKGEHKAVDPAPKTAEPSNVPPDLSEFDGFI